MFTLNGEFGKAIFEGNTGPNGEKNSPTNYLSLNTKAAVNFFRRISVLKTNIVLNSLGLYSFGKMGRNGEVRFASMNAPKHVLSPRTGKGCSFTAKGRIDMGVTEFYVDPVQYQGKQCPDSLYETNFERIFGTGHGIKDLMGTPEGKKLFGEIVYLTYIGLGNSFYEMATYAGHDLIFEADSNDWYTVDDKQWEDYLDQQDTKRMVGHMTIIDKLASEQGLEHFNVEIAANEISDDGKDFIGEAKDLFDRCLEAQPAEMKLANKYRSTVVGKSIFLVSPSIFKKYRRELQEDNMNGIPEDLYYTLHGNFAKIANMNTSTYAEGVLKYDGHVVVEMTEWEAFDTMTGTNTHRCLLASPGVLGLGYDVVPIKQFDGLGLRFVQKLDAPDNGMIYMDTYFDLGSGIVNHDFIVNASRTFVPED